MGNKENELELNKSIRNDKSSDIIVIKAINIQGLSKVKTNEVECLIEENSIVCLTETQKKIRDINFNSNVVILKQMREPKDRKGGGLMLLHQQNKNIVLNKVATRNKDILHVKGSIRGMDIVMIIVYFSVNDKERNSSMKEEIEKILENNIDEALMIIGDINGHVGFKGGQKLDDNGRMILNWLERYKLTMLNDDVKCQGEFTWSRDEQKSVIDYAIVTDKFYDRYKKMKIDEDQDIIDISDHNLIEIQIEVKQNKNYSSKEWITREFYKTDNDSLNKFQLELEENFAREAVKDIHDLEKRIVDTADKVLKGKYRRKNRSSTQEKQEEPVWFTEEIRREIKGRKRYNRLRRNARKEGNKTEEEKWKKMYLEQKIKAQKLIRQAMTMDEEKKAKEIKEDKSNGKNIWKYIRMLKGEKEKEALSVVDNIYGEDKKKLGYEEAATEIETFWRSIYGKHANNIEDEWDENKRELYVQEREAIRENIRKGKHFKILKREENEEIEHLETCVVEVREHLDMEFQIKEGIVFMQE